MTILFFPVSRQQENHIIFHFFSVSNSSSLLASGYSTFSISFFILFFKLKACIEYSCPYICTDPFPLYAQLCAAGFLAHHPLCGECVLWLSLRSDEMFTSGWGANRATERGGVRCVGGLLVHSDHSKDGEGGGGGEAWAIGGVWSHLGTTP